MIVTASMTLADVAQLVRSRRFHRGVRRYGSVTVRTTRLGTIRRPFISLLAARLMSRGPVVLTDRTGVAVRVGFRDVASAGLRLAADGLRSASLLRATDSTLNRLEVQSAARRRPVLTAGP